MKQENAFARGLRRLTQMKIFGTGGNGENREVRGMFVKGMERSVLRIIPLTIIPLTFLRAFPSAILPLLFGCGWPSWPPSRLNQLPAL
jgi:hypothetical protein